MREIPLNWNQVALVDDDKYEELSKYKWFVVPSQANRLSFYVARAMRIDAPKWKKKQRIVFMHRELMGLQPGDKRQVDHINRNPLDNRMENLRIVTHQENQQNRSGVRGFQTLSSGKYQPRITVDKRTIFLPVCDTPEAAHAAYLAAKRIYHPTAPPMD